MIENLGILHSCHPGLCYITPSGIPIREHAPVAPGRAVSFIDSHRCGAFGMDAEVLAIDDHLNIAQRLATIEPYPADRFRDRGIVVCAGGSRIFINAYVLVRILREILGCDLPIQLWHIGPQELCPAMRALLDPVDVECIDARVVQTKYPACVADGWQLKPYALIHSRFEEVLLLDADQVPVRDPAEIFLWPQYLETGALFWPDIVDLLPENPVWRMCGLEPRRSISLESGQLVIDKRRHWRSLTIVQHLNQNARTLYQLVYGDKDTFLLGWLITKAKHAVAPHRPFADPRCIVQRDFAGAPLFQHRTNAKWTYAHTQVDIPNFTHQEACLRIIEDLRNGWNGRLYCPPDRSLAARKVETSLISQQMRLVVADEAEVEVTFLAGHQFGPGRGPRLQNWYVADGEHGPELVLRDIDQDTFRFTPLPNGSWAGCSISAPRADAFLVPPRASEEERMPSVSACEGLVADLVSASGVTAFWTDEAATELFTALQLLDRADPGVADRLRAFAADRCRRNDRLSQRLKAIADRLPAPAAPPAAPYPGSMEVLRRGYSPGW